MNVKQIIPANHHLERTSFQKNGERFLNVSEFYYDTIQGEGIYTGVPAAFLRLKGCQLNCCYCDTTEVWRYGTPFTYDELFALIDRTDLVLKLKKGQHLVITGGSPLLQMDRLKVFMVEFVLRYKFKPFVEIENECSILPELAKTFYVDCWNNSPKLDSSGLSFEQRYQPDIVHWLSQQPNSWFKFVITCDCDWNEIDTCYLVPQLIRREQIILMPEGATQTDIAKHRELTIDMAISNSVRYCTREHIVVWDKRVGI